jgi:hypothetical protein
MKARRYCGSSVSFILILIILSGCYTRIEKQPSGARPAPPPGHPIREPTVTVVHDSLVNVSLTLSDSLVSSYHPVDVRVCITNLSGRSIRWGRGSSTCRMQFLVSANGGDYRAYISGRICTADMSPYYLGPGEIDCQKLTWKTLVRNGDGGRKPYGRLAPGEYMLIGRAGFYRSSPVRVRVTGE